MSSYRLIYDLGNSSLTQFKVNHKHLIPYILVSLMFILKVAKHCVLQEDYMRTIACEWLIWIKIFCQNRFLFELDPEWNY